MKKESTPMKGLLSKAGNPAYIAGIYNYCDRWCERCAFTRRCMVYTIDEEMFPDQESRDINNKKFWDALHRIFAQTMNLLQKFASEEGIDINDVDVSAEETRTRERMKEAKNSPPAQAARKYSIMADTWFEQHASLFEDKDIRLRNEVTLGIGTPKADAANITDAVEVIHWYQDQIWVKLMRALDMDDIEGDELDEEMNEFPSDSDGSAKVALIGIDRSIGAWGTILIHCAEAGESIMEILIHLGRLREEIEDRFPDARRFVRPGFDQEI